MIVADIANLIKQCYRDKTGQGSRQLSRFIMLIFLAESKTMSSEQVTVSTSEFIDNRPVFEADADAIMKNMSSMTSVQISDVLDISNSLAIKCHSLAYDFPHKQTGYSTLKAFTGEAFKSFDSSSLSKEGLVRANNELRIISSVYGLLKPSDIVKPYRCEFNKEIVPGPKTPIQLFKSKITIEVVNYIKQNKIQDIIDLLPGNADKCIDWKIVRAYAKVHKVVFQNIDSTGKLKTPIAKRLKELRGLMARIILEEGIQSFTELTSVESSQFIYSPNDSKPGLPVFISA